MLTRLVGLHSKRIYPVPIRDQAQVCPWNIYVGLKSVWWLPICWFVRMVWQ